MARSTAGDVIFCTIGYCLEYLYRKNKGLDSDLLSLKAFILFTFTTCKKFDSETKEK